MKTRTIAPILFLSISFNASAQPKLDEALLRSAFIDLKDPSSAQFRNVKYGKGVPGAWPMCGEFNAKNSYGGYVGFQRFSGIASVDPKTKKTTYAVFGTGEAADVVCAQEGLL